jgi:ketosteroid isomerase-like protein
LCLAVSGGTLAQPLGQDAVAAESVVRSFHEALLRGDGAAVRRILAPDAVVIESGQVESREEYLRHHLASDIEFARAVPSTITALVATVSGQTAWVRSTSTSQGTFRDRAIRLQGAELVVLTRGSTSWEIRAIHWSSHESR